MDKDPKNITFVDTSNANKQPVEMSQSEKDDYKKKLRQKARAKKAAEKTKAVNETFSIQLPNQSKSAFKIHRRHFVVFYSFIVLVLGPVFGLYYYLEARAADQYSSTLGFTVRQEETPNPLDILGGVISGGGGGADSDILFEFIQSQQLVDKIQNKIDLKTMYSKPQGDPYFAFDASGSIEELHQYWFDMVKIFYDTSTGLIEVRVLAFEARDAQRIAEEILAESSAMINELSSVAQQDATRLAKAERDQAIETLKNARLALTNFRNINQIVDPNTSLQTQMGLLGSLQQQLADTLVEFDLLLETTQPSDPRLNQAKRKIEVIKTRIADERSNLAVPNDGEKAFSALVGEFEELQVDLNFAEQTYVAALSAFNGAVGEASRQSRYLAAYIKPTLAETSVYPRRETIVGLSLLFLFLFWAIVVLIYYSVRDRRV